MSSLTPTLPKSVARKLLSSDTTHDAAQYATPGTFVYSNDIRALRSDDELYQLVESILESRLLEAAHSFRVQSIEIVNTPEIQLTEFKSRLEKKKDGQIRFLFHGTKAANYDSIFDNGFSLDDEHFGDTDTRYVEKGVYLTPDPEYCAAYIKETAGITKYQFSEPVQVGLEFQVLGCIALVGTTQQVTRKEVGMVIPESLDSHWAYLDSTGNVTGNVKERFTEEYVFREPESVYPRFRITLKRIEQEVIWVDRKISNSENSQHVEHLKGVPSFFLYATADSRKALEALKKRKPGTEYRAMTAGRGGEDFVKKLRREGITCKVLVFCGTVSKHKPWADKIQDTAVTASGRTMYSFATWADY